jgi:hypothetical protein
MKLEDIIPKDQRRSLYDLKKDLKLIEKEIKIEEKETRKQEMQSEELGKYMMKLLRG